MRAPDSMCATFTDANGVVWVRQDIVAGLMESTDTRARSQEQSIQLNPNEVTTCVAAINQRIKHDRLRIEMDTDNVGYRESNGDEDIQELQLLTQKMAASIGVFL